MDNIINQEDLLRPAAKPVGTSGGLNLGSSLKKKEDQVDAKEAFVGFTYFPAAPAAPLPPPPPPIQPPSVQRKPQDSLFQDLHDMNLNVRSYQHFKYFDNRLMTFDTWPKSHPIKSSEFAAAGFFYTGKGDKVICPFCQVRLIKWEKDDNPLFEHIRHRPKCEYVRMVC